jgi:peptidoglycan/xylan/chitin deacetylase (PgdA/CDA1 family)
MSLLASTIASFVAGVALVPALQLGNIAIGRAVLRPKLRRRLAAASRGSLVLTYDDGPSTRMQSAILELLRARGAKATFYLLESRSEGQRERIEELTRDGHEIATHSFGHLDAYRVSAKSACADLRAGLAVCDATGRRVDRFRPPCGRVTLATYRAALRAGLSFDLWTHDSGDTFATCPSVASIVDAIDAAHGGVVLLHSHDRGTNRPDAEAHTLAVTRALLDLADRRGLVVRRMCDLPT